MGGHGNGGTVPPPQAGTYGGYDTSSKALLNSQSKGAVGVKNLEMGDNGVLTSPGKEVKLEANTQMMIRAE